MVFKLKQILQYPWLSSSRLLGFLLLVLQTSFVQTGILDIMTQAAKQHPGKSAVCVLKKGEESLLTRAWLTEAVNKSIDVQYLIWRTDNIGTLASERLLSAAERGARIRVIVDDLLIDAGQIDV